MSQSEAKRLRERLNNELKRASLDHCVKCTICEQNCPVAGVTILFSGPKFVGPQAERFRDGASVDHSVDYCSSCGTCTVVCPQGVKVAEINSLARAVMKAEHGVPVRDRLITQTTLMGKAMTPVAPIANAVLGNGLARKAMQAVVGVHADAPMPTAHTQTLRGWLKKRPARSTPATRGSVVFFHGCAGGYFEVEAAKCAIEVLEHLGYDVIVPEQGCCGLAEQSNGLFEQASASVRSLVAQLRKPGAELPIVSVAGRFTPRFMFFVGSAEVWLALMTTGCRPDAVSRGMTGIVPSALAGHPIRTRPDSVRSTAELIPLDPPLVGGRSAALSSATVLTPDF